MKSKVRRNSAARKARHTAPHATGRTSQSDIRSSSNPLDKLGASGFSFKQRETSQRAELSLTTPITKSGRTGGVQCCAGFVVGVENPWHTESQVQLHQKNAKTRERGTKKTSCGALTEKKSVKHKKNTTSESHGNRQSLLWTQRQDQR
jgi:hypothetical protein